MKKFNRRMAKAFEEVNLARSELSVSLRDIATSGFVEVEGCVFVNALWKRETNASHYSFFDDIERECFHNSIHVEDYVSSNLLANACLYVGALFREWQMYDKHRVLQAVISFNGVQTVVKVHLFREGESWVSENLEAYEEAILLWDSSELELVGVAD